MDGGGGFVLADEKFERLGWENPALVRREFTVCNVLITFGNRPPSEISVPGHQVTRQTWEE